MTPIPTVFILLAPPEFHRRALAYCGRNQHRKAIEDYRRAIEDVTESLMRRLWYFNDLAVCYLEHLHDPESALSTIDRALDESKNTSHADDYGLRELELRILLVLQRKDEFLKIMNSDIDSISRIVNTLQWDEKGEARVDGAVIYCAAGLLDEIRKRGFLCESLLEQAILTKEKQSEVNRIQGEINELIRLF